MTKLEILDRLMDILWPMAVEGDEWACDMCARIVWAQARLLGVSTP